MSHFARISALVAIAALTALGGSACEPGAGSNGIDFVINGTVTDDSTPPQPVILQYGVGKVCCAPEASGAQGLCRDIESNTDGIFHHVGYLEKTADGRDLTPAGKLLYACITDAAHPPTLLVQGQNYPVKIEDVNGRPSGDLAQDLGGTSIMIKASTRLPQALARRLNDRAWGRDPGVTAASGDVPGLLADAQRRLEVPITLTAMVRTADDQRAVERAARLIAGDEFVQAFKEFNRHVFEIRYLTLSDSLGMGSHAVDAKEGGFMWVIVGKSDAEILAAIKGVHDEQNVISDILQSAASQLGATAALAPIDVSVVLGTPKAALEAKARAWAAALRAPAVPRLLADFQNACGGRPGETQILLGADELNWYIAPDRVSSKLHLEFAAAPQAQLASLKRAVADCRRATPPGAGTSSTGPDRFAGMHPDPAPAPGSSADNDQHLDSAQHSLGISSVVWGAASDSAADQRRIALLVDTSGFAAKFAELNRQCGRGGVAKLYLSDHFGIDPLTSDASIDMRRSNADVLATLDAKAAECESVQQYFDSRIAPAAGGLKLGFAMDLVVSQGGEATKRLLDKWLASLQGAAFQGAYSELVSTCKVAAPTVYLTSRARVTYAGGGDQSALVEWNAFGNLESQQPVYAGLERVCKPLASALDRLNAVAVGKGLVFVESRPDSDTGLSRAQAIGQWSAFFLADPSRIEQFRQVIERSDYLHQLPKRCVLDASFPASLGSAREERCAGRPTVTEVGFGDSWSYDSSSRRIQVNLFEPRPKVPDFVRIDGMYDTSFDGPGASH